MLRLPTVRTAAGVTGLVAVLAGGPVLATTVSSTPPGPMPAAWEQGRAYEAQQSAASHATALKVQAERRAAEKARKAEERRQAEEARKAQERRQAEERAARARAQQSGTPAKNRTLGQSMCRDRGWSASQCEDLGRLWQRESGWDHTAHNSASGDYGIPQALPGGKMASAGGDWRTNPRTQIAWGLGYIAGRYGNPSNAWAHAQRTGWY